MFASNAVMRAGFGRTSGKATRMAPTGQTAPDLRDWHLATTPGMLGAIWPSGL
jgi:hypothetical protein